MQGPAITQNFVKFWKLLTHHRSQFMPVLHAGMLTWRVCYFVKLLRNSGSTNPVIHFRLFMRLAKSRDFFSQLTDLHTIFLGEPFISLFSPLFKLAKSCLRLEKIFTRLVVQQLVLFSSLPFILQAPVFSLAEI